MKKMNYMGKTFDQVIIDTSSLLRTRGFETLMCDMIRAGVVLTIPQCTLREIKRFTDEASERGNQACRALENVNALMKEGYVVLEGNPNSAQTPDSYILEQVVMARSKKQKIMVITQDGDLAMDILQMNTIRSSWAPAVNVKRISPFGQLEDFDLSRPANAYSPKKNPTYDTTKAVLKRFGL